MKSGIFRASVAGTAFNISFFVCVHMFIFKIYKVIIQATAELSCITLKNNCLEGLGG
jgi:hypothetical protein